MCLTCRGTWLPPLQKVRLCTTEKETAVTCLAVKPDLCQIVRFCCWTDELIETPQHMQTYTVLIR